MGAIQQLISSFAGAGINYDVLCVPASIDPSVTIDGNTLATWEDISGNGLDATISGSVVLNLSGTERQVQFNGGWIDFPTSAIIDKDVGTPGGDSFTVVYREGDVVPTGGTMASKAVGIGGDREWQIFYNNANAISFNIAGNEDWNSTAISAGTNRLFIFTIVESALTLWVDGVLVIDNVVGLPDSFKSASAQVMNLGTRTSGGFKVSSGAQIDMFALIPTEINSNQRAVLEATWQIN